MIDLEETKNVTSLASGGGFAAQSENGYGVFYMFVGENFSKLNQQLLYFGSIFHNVFNVKMINRTLCYRYIKYFIIKYNWFILYFFVLRKQIERSQLLEEK